MSSKSKEITVITSSSALNEFTTRLKNEEFITVDTEFLRDKTYYPILCLVQIAGTDNAALIDVLADQIDLTPLFDLMQDTNILKIFHAARQDIEIFYQLTNTIPTPIFDTQIAAMACGYGEMVGYSTLVEAILGVSIDKKERFTNWAQRPLTTKQQHYALSDVTYLRSIYHALQQELNANQRLSWLEDEINTLTNPKNYMTDPQTIWKKMNTKSVNPRFLMLVRDLYLWREDAAASIDIPRNHVFKEHAILELAASCPGSHKELKQLRGLGGTIYNHKGLAESLLACIALTQEKETDPHIVEQYLESRPKKEKETHELLVSMFKMLLKYQSERCNVAARLLTNNDELLSIARLSPEALEQKRDHFTVMTGWRYPILGQYLKDLHAGHIALSVRNDQLHMIKI